MMRFPLLLRNLTFEDIEDTSSGDCYPTQIALFFDKGQIPDPVSGKRMVDVKGFFLLALPQGQFPEIPLYDMDRFDSFLRNWVIEHCILDHNATTELESLFLYPLKNVFLVAPQLKPWSIKTELFLKGCFLWWSIDDFLVRAVTSATPLLTKEHFTDLIRFITNIMTGMYRYTDAIPNLDVPFLNNALICLFNVYQGLQEHVSGYDKYYIYLLREFVNWIQFYKVWALYMGSNWEPVDQPYFVARKLSGKRMVLELIQLLTSTYLDDVVREHVLFKLFCESSDLIHNMAYDVLSVRRYSGTKKSNRNILLKTVKTKGVPFDEALEHHLSSFNNEMIEFRKIAKALSLEFPKSEPLKRYMLNSQCFVDGSIQYFASQERYGKCEYKFMKVLSKKKSTE